MLEVLLFTDKEVDDVFILHLAAPVHTLETRLNTDCANVVSPQFTRMGGFIFNRGSSSDRKGRNYRHRRRHCWGRCQTEGRELIYYPVMSVLYCKLLICSNRMFWPHSPNKLIHTPYVIHHIHRQIKVRLVLKRDAFGLPRISSPHM